jgi:hypothetical protein
MQGTQEDMKRRVENVRKIWPAENESKATSLMQRKHLINLIEAVTKRKIFESSREWNLSRRPRT